MQKSLFKATTRHIPTADELATKDGMGSSAIYPDLAEVIGYILNKEPDRKKWTDETVYDAISSWDVMFADDPYWFDEECNDIKDELRDAVEDALGLEFS